MAIPLHCSDDRKKALESDLHGHLIHLERPIQSLNIEFVISIRKSRMFILRS
jgi:hypothetical protein